jgi:hypothetical protein
MTVAIDPQPRRRVGPAAVLGAGAVLAVGAAAIAPSSAVLPGPDSAGAVALAAVLFAAAFAVGAWFPAQSFYGAIVLTLLEGAIRRWIYNDIVVFLLKDFVFLGIYAAVIPRLSRERLARPWWLLVPLGALIALALVYTLRAPSMTQAAIGLRSYVVYVPLLWVAPVILDRRSRGIGLLLLLGVAGLVEGFFGVLQSLAGTGVLNKIIPGTSVAAVTVDNIQYYRPTGTTMQSAVLSYVLAVGAVAAGALLVWSASRRVILLAGAVVFTVSTAIVYSGARTLLGSVVIVFVILTGSLLLRRRWRFAVALPLVVGIGVLTGLKGTPYIGKHAVPVVKGWFGSGPPHAKPAAFKTMKPLTIVQPSGAELRIRFDPGQASFPDNRPEVLITAYRAKSREQVMVWVPSKPLKTAAKAPAPPAALAAPPTVTGRVQPDVPSTSVTSSFLRRATEIDTAGGAVSGGLWATRIEPQLRAIAHGGLVGHGTGTMSLGAQYVNADAGAHGEGSYSKFAWELGLPGFLVAVWFFFAMFVLSVRGVARAQGWRTPVSATGATIAMLVLIWMVFGLVNDTPIVAQLFYALAGTAVAVGSGQLPTGREPASPT